MNYQPWPILSHNWSPYTIYMYIITSSHNWSFYSIHRPPRLPDDVGWISETMNSLTSSAPSAHGGGRRGAEGPVRDRMIARQLICHDLLWFMHISTIIHHYFPWFAMTYTRLHFTMIYLIYTVSFMGVENWVAMVLWDCSAKLCWCHVCFGVDFLSFQFSLLPSHFAFPVKLLFLFRG